MEDSSVSRSGQSQHCHEPTIDTFTNTDVHDAVQAVEINYTDSSQQDQYQPQFMAQQHQQQQDYQPPQQQQQQSQAQQYPTQPQTNQAYGAQPTVWPFQFPRPAQGPQPITLQPGQFPPQNPNQPTAYPPQPAQFRPQNPTQPAAYPPHASHSSQPQSVQFPPQPPAYPQNLPNRPVHYPPQSPHMNPTCPPQPTSGIYPPQEKPEVYLQRQAFTQPACQSTWVQGIPMASVDPGQGPIDQQRQNDNGQWSTGLFDCMEDPDNAILTAVVPCVTFGQIAEIVDNGQTSCSNNGLFYGLIAAFIAMPCIMSFGYRTKLRARYGLIEAPGPDWAVHCFFEWCALCQEYRELKHRGFDPAIGWQGNIGRQRMQPQQVAMTPPMKQQMMS